METAITNADLAKMGKRSLKALLKYVCEEAQPAARALLRNADRMRVAAAVGRSLRNVEYLERLENRIRRQLAAGPDRRPALRV